MARATIKEIAAHAGVSVGTASRALSGNGSVAQATRDKILRSAAALHYVPNAHARSLRSSRTSILGLLIPDVHNPYFGELAHLIEQKAHDRGFSLLLCGANEDPALMRSYATVLQEQRVDGIIAAPFFSARTVVDEIAARGTPLVFLDRTIPNAGISAAVSDTSNAIDEAVRWAASNGCTKLGVLAGPQETSTGRERLEQVSFSAARHGLETMTSVGDFRWESGYEGFSRLSPTCSHIFCADSRTTTGALRAAVESDHIIGTTIHMIGFDEDALTALAFPAMPMIVQDLEAMATAALDLLLPQLSCTGPPTEVRIPATFLQTPSLAPPRIEAQP